MASNPSHGTLSGFVPSTGAIIYTPTANYQGKDSFTFTVSNQSATSAAATVTLTVAPGTPTATPQSVAVAHNTAKTITLAGTDPDNPVLTLKFALASSPSHGTLGTLNASTGAVTYTPAANYQGLDSFTFTVSNGTNTSTPATVSLKVAAGTPTANAQSVTTPPGSPIKIILTGSDPDNPLLPLTFAIATKPSHGILGSLNIADGQVTYTPDSKYTGPDSFTFTVSNGTNTSAPATVSIAVGGT